MAKSHNSTLTSLSATILAFPAPRGDSKTKRNRRVERTTESTAAIVSFPAAQVAAKAERERRIARARAYLFSIPNFDPSGAMDTTPDHWWLGMDTMPEHWWLGVAECLEGMGAV